MQGDIPSKALESFIDKDFVNIYHELRERHGWSDTRNYNKFFYTNHPKIPKSTVKRWSKAFVSGTYHSVTPDWHVRYREDVSLVPERFSDLRNGRWLEEKKRLSSFSRIKYVNAGDFHWPRADGALVSLLAMVVEDYKPNVMPYFCDWLEQDQFSLHAPQMQDGGEKTDSPVNRYKEVEILSDTLINIFDSVLPEDCIRLNLWGNHEDFILRYLGNIGRLSSDNDIFDYFVDKLFTKYQNNNILWLEPDRNLYIPLTPIFWVTHGRNSRNSEGGTAKSYMSKVKHAVSMAAQHTHRQEVLWTTTPVGEHFYAISGTLGDRIRAWNRNDFRSHNWGFQLIDHPVDTWRGAHVEDVRVHYKDGFYVCRANGKEYSIQSTIRYEELPMIDGLV